ncbi:MAG: 30S ribosomal protein S20 [bacterium]|nr:30S ribosomal protein S20 [bacterium]
MAITSSAKKAIRSSGKKRIFNIRRKNVLHDATKALVRAHAAGDINGAAQLLPASYKAIDKAAKRGVLKANTAARKKSRLARLVRTA